ncbi:MAG TPA: vitamin B12-dependent ribonucleotide reductase [Dehalococcoidia bacterium]|nr:vitamin B12-dependent ribonucleotide reductase [Dehalococcoidia bacterium]
MPDYELKNNNSEQVDHDRIARAVFAAAESIGISDRNLTEQLTEQVIQRLERQEAGLPFPGMEDVVLKRKRRGKRGLESPEIKGIVKEALAEMGHHEIAEAYLKEPKPLPVVVRRKEEEKTAAGEAALGLSPNALRVLEKRYLKKDSEGRVIETLEEMFHRVAHCIASAELAYNPQAEVKALEKKFYQLMVNLEFLPNSPTLMNAGRELGQLSACFVLPIEDSMESIFEAVKQTALIHKSGGGTGFSFSRLRPENDRVGSTGGVASGPVSFLRAFDTATDVIKQGGMRRGANMAILNVDHPDILKFITAKENTSAFSNFNLSVAVTEDFMKAVEESAEYGLINPHTKQVVERLKAKDIFDKIVDMAWRTGDPGIIFLDRINNDNPTPRLGRIESTNPCGEQPLLPYESCNLGAINLSQMLHQRKGKVEIDYPKLARTVKLAVRFLDNVIEANKFPSPQIEEMTKKTRKIGLGVMGFADMLIQLGIPYDSGEALEIAEQVMHVILKEATEASVELAKERGVFPAFEGSIYDVPGGPRLRNACRTTIAPTGTLSIIANCSSGIEPLFALSYIRTILEGEQLVEVNPYFEEVAKKEGFYTEELMRELSIRGSVRGMDGVPEWVQRLFVTAHDIAPQWHVKMQAAFQSATNNGVSKTVNFPQHATREDVAEVYRLAYQLGCKGITIYRDRSKESQVLSVSREKEIEALAPRRRARITTGFTERVSTGCGHIYVTVNKDEQGICEVFSSLGKAGGCASAQLEAISRLISLSLRSGIEVSSIVKHLRGIRCPSIAWEEGHAVLSCPDAIGSVLEKEIQGDSPRGNLEGVAIGNLGQCPECGNHLVYQEGCFLCPSCGYTKCS